MKFKKGEEVKLIKKNLLYGMSGKKSYIVERSEFGLVSLVGVSSKIEETFLGLLDDPISGSIFKVGGFGFHFQKGWIAVLEVRLDAVIFKGGIVTLRDGRINNNDICPAVGLKDVMFGTLPPQYIDWSKVPIDTKICLRGSSFVRRFCAYLPANDKIIYFISGRPNKRATDVALADGANCSVLGTPRKSWLKNG